MGIVEKIKSMFIATPGKKWKCVLVIDDDETVIKMVRPVLVANGFSVLTADSGEDGLHMALNQKPDLIILDVIMPGMKGREVCKRLKEDAATKHIPIVFMTAKDSADDVKAELDVGGATHLTKPVNNQILIETVKRILKC